MLDEHKLTNYLTQRLVAASRLHHRSSEQSLASVKMAQEMEVITDLIELVESGKFQYEYEVLEDALEDYEGFISSAEKVI